MINIPPSRVDEHGNRFHWSDQIGKHVTIPGDRGRLGECDSYPVSVFVAGYVSEAAAICQQYCDAVGLCVTITETRYIYTGGEEAGVIVGLINYPRFPAEPAAIFAKAEELAHRLIEGMGQRSASIQAIDKTVWIGEPLTTPENPHG